MSTERLEQVKRRFKADFPGITDDPDVRFLIEQAEKAQDSEQECERLRQEWEDMRGAAMQAEADRAEAERELAAARDAAGALHLALTRNAEALDSIWAAIGDALCSGSGIEKGYANSVSAQVAAASNRARVVLAAPAAAEWRARVEREAVAGALALMKRAEAFFEGSRSGWATTEPGGRVEHTVCTAHSGVLGCDLCNLERDLRTWITSHEAPAEGTSDEA